MKTVVSLDAGDPTGSKYGVTQGARIMLRCGGGTLGAFILTPNQLQSDYETHSVVVRLRFDGNTPEGGNWSESEGGDAMLAPHPRALMSRLLKTQQLLVEYRPFRRTPVTVTFTTTGLADQVEHTAGCPVS